MRINLEITVPAAAASADGCQWWVSATGWNWASADDLAFDIDYDLLHNLASGDLLENIIAAAGADSPLASVKILGISVRCATSASEWVQQLDPDTGGEYWYNTLTCERHCP